MPSLFEKAAITNRVNTFHLIHFSMTVSTDLNDNTQLWELAGLELDDRIHKEIDQNEAIFFVSSHLTNATFCK